MEEARRLAYLKAMGVDVWLLRRGSRNEVLGAREDQDLAPSNEELTGGAQSLETKTKAVPSPSHLGPSTSTEASALGPRPSSSALAELERVVAACQKCELHRTRTQTVFGVGNPNADLMIIGEAPGADEDRQGEPFVGRAGQLLNAMLQAIGLRREDVYIANILKCRPPGNRNPSLEEAAACQGYLERQIELIQPKLILSVGAVSARNLLGTEEAVGRLRRRIHHFGPAQIPLLVTYHPAYLLRRPEEKAKAWEDLQEAARRLV